jgi:hypothetical protein
MITAWVLWLQHLAAACTPMTAKRITQSQMAQQQHAKMG